MNCPGRYWAQHPQKSLPTSEWRETDQLFPYGGQYDKLRDALQIQSTLDGRPLADPNAWYAATTRFLTLLRNFPKNVEDVDLDPQTGTTSRDLDPTIETGRSIQEFLRKAAFDQDRKSLNKKSFQRLFGLMANNYRSVLQQLRRETASTGVHADIKRPKDRQVVRLPLP